MNLCRIVVKRCVCFGCVCAAAVLLIEASPADADVVRNSTTYTLDTSTIDIVTGVPTVDIDIDQDGTTDVELTYDSSGGSLSQGALIFTNPSVPELRGVGFSTNPFFLDGQPLILYQPPGKSGQPDTIPADGNFSNGPEEDKDQFDSKEYVGVRFQDAKGKDADPGFFVIGQLSVTYNPGVDVPASIGLGPVIDVGSTFTISDIAYETEPDVDLVVTAAPEPSSLAVLGFGGLGLLTRRRNLRT